MIIRPKTCPLRFPLTAYDFEWRKEESGKLHITLCGAYDERGYRWYQDITSFVRGELVAGNAGRRYYAHFGGASDMVFLLRELMRDRELQLRGLFSGSSAIVVSASKRSGRWTFLDSFWTMRVSLAEIGKWKGLPKLDIDHTKHIPLGELIDYNERDCRLLYEAVQDFQTVVNDRGGELRVTGASTALDLFVRRYLKRPLNNSPHIDAYVRPAYVASRVEKLQDECVRAKVWDINSSFPFSMLPPLPGEIIGSGENGMALPTDGLWCADVDVNVPEQYLPPLPYRGEKDKRIYFPTGRFRTRITSEDFLCGDFDIERVYSWRSFEPRDDMRAFAEELYQLRRGSGFAAQVWKIILNSLYGKFAEKEEKEVLLVNPERRPDPMCSTAIAPHIFLVEESVAVPHSHVPSSGFITARSRRYIREHALDANRVAPIFYLDTDSVIAGPQFAPKETGVKLGQLKLECEIEDGVFHGPKLYAYRKLDGREVAKAKGFSRVVSEGGERQPLTYSDFADLREGSSVTVERMRRIRELLREGKDMYDPDVVQTQKALGTPRPKRCALPSGDSRPWTYAEVIGWTQLLASPRRKK